MYCGLAFYWLRFVYVVWCMMMKEAKGIVEGEFIALYILTKETDILKIVKIIP